MSQFKTRRLTVVPNVLTLPAQQRLIAEAQRLRPLAIKNRKLLQVHSGLLHQEQSLLLQFAQAPALTALVNAATDEPEPLGVCPGSLDAKYSLYKADFGTKLNYYEGSTSLNSIGWHYDKNNSWVNNTFVVIYTILLRPTQVEDVAPPLVTVPPTYEIIEHGKRVAFVIAENSLHIHDTNNIYHRAVVPAGWRREIFILHFTKAPCIPGPRRVGYTPSLIARNIGMRAYVDFIVLPKWWLWTGLIASILAIIAMHSHHRKKKQKAITAEHT